MGEGGESDGRAARLIAQGANPDATESNRRTPLHVAAFDSKPEAIRALVKGGANPNTLDAQRGV